MTVLAPSRRPDFVLLLLPCRLYSFEGLEGSAVDVDDGPSRCCEDNDPAPPCGFVAVPPPPPDDEPSPPVDAEHGLLGWGVLEGLSPPCRFDASSEENDPECVGPQEFGKYLGLPLLFRFLPPPPRCLFCCCGDCGLEGDVEAGTRKDDDTSAAAAESASTAPLEHESPAFRYSSKEDQVRGSPIAAILGEGTVSRNDTARTMKDDCRGGKNNLTSTRRPAWAHKLDVAQ
jgi:hypothetical protein